jgi:hypothetical protein
MDSKIPAQLKKYIKKARANRRENKITYKSPKQVAKQNQVVIINQESRKRGPYKKRGIGGNGGSGGGSDGQYPRIVYIPQSVPNMSIPMHNPEQIRQDIPQMMNHFAAQPVYRNPFRMEPFRTALNPPPFTENKPALINMDRPIFTRPLQPSPPPIEPDIVLEHNSLIMPSSPAQAYPISPGGSSSQGFTQNEAVNQLNEQILKEEKAYEDFGGDDAQQMRLAKQLSGGSYYEHQQRLFGSEPLSPLSDIPVRVRGSGGSGNRGRPFTSLTKDEQKYLHLYYVYQYDKSKKKLDEASQRDYEQGKLIAKNKSGNPLVKEIKDNVIKQINKK